MDDESASTTSHLKRITCPVCCDKFKTPKILQCGHTFCQQCVHHLLQAQPILCPVCRKKVTSSFVIRNISAEALPTNYALKALVEEDTRPFDKDSIRGSLPECPSHNEPCDQFCSTCERQLCKQCVSANHGAPGHDTAPVMAVVVQQTEIVENLTRDLRDVAERLKCIEENVAASEKACEAEAEQLVKEINSSVAQSSRNVSSNAVSLQTLVETNKQELLKYLENLRLEHSELSLSAAYTVDLCESLQKDLNKNNLSRLGVIKRLNYNNNKMKNLLKKLEGNEINLNMGLRFQSLAQEPKVGKLITSQSLIPVAKHTRAISLQDIKGSLRGFIWPFPYWMIAVTQESIGKHNFVEFYNINFFFENHFTHEIGIEDNWSYVSGIDYSGRYILCLADGKIQKFLFSSKENERKTGKTVGTVFLPTAVDAISWDEKQVGCYALEQDKKTLLHIEFEGQMGYSKVAVLEKEIATSSGTHVLHVNAEGSMAVCDREAKTVHFFMKIGTEPTLSVKAPPDFENAVPECVNTRKEDMSWYVLWKLLDDYECSYHLAVYDFSFTLQGSVEGLTITGDHYENDKAMFCFQEEYLAVVAGREVALHALH